MKRHKGMKRKNSGVTHFKYCKIKAQGNIHVDHISAQKKKGR